MSSREERRAARAELQAKRRAERGPRAPRGGGAAEPEEPEEPNFRWFDGAGEMVTDPEPPAVLQQATARSRAASEREQLFILFVAETVCRRALSQCRAESGPASRALINRNAAVCMDALLQAPATGKTWCPDCNNAQSFLAPFFAALPPTAAVIEAAVSRDEWKGTGPHSVGDNGSGGIGASGHLGENPTGADHPYRKLPWQADGVPCLVRWGRYGVVDRLSEAELNALVGGGADSTDPRVTSFFGLTSTDAITGDVLAGPGYLQISGLPANPAGAIAAHLKDALGLSATPDVIRQAELAVARPRSVPDVATCRSAAGSLTLLGSTVRLEWVEAKL